MKWDILLMQTKSETLSDMKSNAPLPTERSGAL